MSSEVSPWNLPSIQNLFDSKIQKLNLALGNWNMQNVRDDDAFENSIERLKNLILLAPIALGEPKISNHRSENKKFAPNYSNPFGGNKTVNVITVGYPVTGSIELFDYSTNGYSISSSDTEIYKPYSDEIIIEVNVDTLDRETAINAANEKMRTTLKHISQVNPVAIAWSQGIEPTLVNRANIKRQEILALYR